MLPTSPTSLLLAPLLCVSCLSFEEREVLPIDPNGTTILVVEGPTSSTALVVDPGRSQVFVEASERVREVHHFACPPATLGQDFGRFELNGEFVRARQSWALDDGLEEVGRAQISVGVPLEVVASGEGPASIASVGSMLGHGGSCASPDAVLGTGQEGSSFEFTVDEVGTWVAEAQPGVLDVVRSECLGEVRLTNRELLVRDRKISLTLEERPASAGALVVRCEDPPVIAFVGGRDTGVVFLEGPYQDDAWSRTTPNRFETRVVDDVGLVYVAGDYYASIHSAEPDVWETARLAEDGTILRLVVDAFGSRERLVRYVRPYEQGLLLDTAAGFVIRRPDLPDTEVELCDRPASAVQELVSIGDRFVYLTDSGEFGWAPALDRCLEEAKPIGLSEDHMSLRPVSGQALVLSGTTSPYPVVGAIGARAGSETPSPVN